MGDRALREIATQRHHLGHWRGLYGRCSVGWTGTPSVEKSYGCDVKCPPIAVLQDRLGLGQVGHIVQLRIDGQQAVEQIAHDIPRLGAGGEMGSSPATSDFQATRSDCRKGNCCYTFSTSGTNGGTRSPSNRLTGKWRKAGQWVFDPERSGIKIPEAIKRHTEDRIRSFAETHFAGR
jgi:hypothetical protein